MKKFIFNLMLIAFFMGCGGGGSGSSSGSSTPKIILSNESLELEVGETKSVKTRVANMPEGNSSVETKIDTTLYDPYVIDFVTYTVSDSNDKDVHILVYGANEGESVIDIIADNGKTKVPTQLKVKVVAVDEEIDTAVGDINVHNSASGVTSISKIFETEEKEIIAKLELDTPSICGSSTFINESDINFEIDEQKVLINLNLFRYNIQGDREFSKVIKDLNVTSEEKRENNEIAVIPYKAIEVNGMDFALNGVDVNNIYRIGLETDMCKAEFRLKLLDLVLDSDADLDGVGDNNDYCKNTPLGSKVDEFGCSIDEDSDGVEDDKDLCPNTLKGTVVNEEGCSDVDGDGVADIYDVCPNEFGTLENGCPDSDGDGVADKDDMCPSEAGNGANGCPLPVPNETAEPTPSTSPTSPTETGGTPSSTPVPTGLVPIDNDENACKTINGYAVASHQAGASSFSNGYLYFRTLTPYLLKLYYKVPSARNLEDAIDLNSYNVPGTSYKFFLEISPALATGDAFYIEGNGKCFKGYFPTIENIERGVFPNKTLTFIK